jgi:hypothetical protein
VVVRLHPPRTPSLVLCVAIEFAADSITKDSDEVQRSMRFSTGCGERVPFTGLIVERRERELHG